MKKNKVEQEINKRLAIALATVLLIVLLVVLGWGLAYQQCIESIGKVELLKEARELCMELLRPR